jgi:hypothetical protein
MMSPRLPPWHDTLRYLVASRALANAAVWNNDTMLGVNAEIDRCKDLVFAVYAPEVLEATYALGGALGLAHLVYAVLGRPPLGPT